jgi:predicted enzyme related to lactoylglutathione lyase
MPTRDKAPAGSPCWVDLWTSDVEGSRKFYTALFGWEAQETNPEFGGYFMFTRGGAPIAGGMGDMGDLRADNRWRIYLETADVARTVAAAESEGGRIIVPATPVADLGVQAVFVDSTGATVGAWQPETFPGFTVLGEHGTPSWFELQTRDHARAVAFYRPSSAGTPGRSAIARSFATRPCATQRTAKNGRASWTRPPSSPRA